MSKDTGESYSRTGYEIAVIGMAGRFPGARDIDEFWQNIKNGVESITFLSEEEIQQAKAADEILENPAYVACKGGVLEDIEYFDAAFFDYIPSEAELMDPQLRILHETVWAAFEDAGYDPGRYAGAVGLYAGASDNLDWQVRVLLSHRSAEVGQFAVQNLMGRDFLCTRIAYKLNLRGPAITVQTACSTSLTAIHMACRALLSGECDMALAGGVSISSVENKGYIYEEGMILSKDGHCRAFDAAASGTIGGRGAGIVVLKTLEDALADRDFIYAVIKGTAINNDGTDKIGYSAPAVDGQAEVIEAALQMAEVSPETVTYIETHGTGTVLGDPIEIEALTQAFKTEKRNYCAIGAVKANIGHLDAAAGAAGFIKTVLALRHKQIPPLVNFTAPNPQIDFENSPFYVASELSQWKIDPLLAVHAMVPLRAGVSSFGIGGTNAHVILEEWDSAGSHMPDMSNVSYSTPQLLVLSARTQPALERMTENLGDYLEKNMKRFDGPGAFFNLADAAYTLQVGRKAFEYRRMWVCADTAQTVQALKNPDNQSSPAFVSRQDENRQVVFMFPGLGGQYVNMGRGLYEQEVFRREMDCCFEILREAGMDIEAILYPDQQEQQSAPGGQPVRSFAAGGNRSNMSYKSYSSHSDLIDHPEFTQLIVFALEYALAKLLMSWGIKPAAMIGYSFGEYTAACISGVFSLKDALLLILRRGRLIEKTQPGVMLSVPLPAEELLPLLPDGLSLAIDNGPSCVVAGAGEAVEGFEKQLQQKKLLCMRVLAERALHSSLMDSIAGEFEKTAAQLQLNKPRIPYVSNVSGSWIKAAEAVDPAYYSAHLRQTVQFAAGVKTLLEKGNPVFVEVGPGNDLSSLMTRHGGKGHGNPVIDLIRTSQRQVDDYYFLLDRLGRLWQQGVNIDWAAFHAPKKRNRVPLPTYAFEPRRFWIEGFSYKPGMEILPGRDSALLSKQPDMGDWFYMPSWKRAQPLLPGSGKTAGGNYLLFLDDGAAGAVLAQEIENRGGSVVVVKPGDRFEIDKSSPGKGAESGTVYRIAPGESGDYDALFRELQQSQRFPGTLIHMWAADGKERGPVKTRQVEDDLKLGFYSLQYIVQALEKISFTGNLNIRVISTGLFDFSGEEAVCPGKAPMLGMIRVIPQEYSNIDCRSIDIWPTQPGKKEEPELIERLLAEIEIAPGGSGPVTMLRGAHRWQQVYEPLELGRAAQSPPLVEKGGVYMITGGLGDIGLRLAEHLARTYKVRLVLTGRSFFPAREEWQRWLEEKDKADPVSRKIQKIADMEKAGARVLVFSADAADYDRMQEVFAQSREQFGSVQGVIHCAGVARRIIKSIHHLDKDFCETQFRAKIHALPVLERLFAGQKSNAPRFCLLVSSLAPILGGLGLAAYSAANLFMEAFVHRVNRETPTRWLCAGIEGWKFGAEDDLHDAGIEREKGAWADLVSTDLALKPAEGIQVFEQLFRLGHMQQVVVSTARLQRRIEQWINREIPGAQEESGTGTTAPRRRRPDLLDEYKAPDSPLEKQLAGMWQDFFGFDKVGINDSFFELGGDSLKAMTLVNRYKKWLGQIVYVQAVFDAPTIAQTAAFFDEHYPDAVARVTGSGSEDHTLYPQKPIDEERVAVVRRLANQPVPRSGKEQPKNKPMVFILSPTRSGSTLLRVMLGGHPRLFSPPELNLLSVDTLDQIALGVESEIRAVMQLKNCGPEEAKAMVDEFMAQGVTTREFYRILQEWLGDRMLVDKSPLYAFNIEILKRAEAEFENPYYIHLIRHPYAMIRSKEQAKLNIVRSPLKEMGVARFEFAELEWVISHRNILEFLDRVPAERQHKVWFEEMVREPRPVMESICEFLQLEFHPEMLNPHKDSKERMTDGIYDQGMMRGDPKFHQHKGINAGVADKWKTFFKQDFLSDLTWKLAESFGYKREKLHIQRFSAIKKAEESDYYPLSPAQKRLYVLYRFDPGSLIYNLPRVYRVDEEIDPRRLEDAFRSVIARHEILRTVFVEIDGQSVQVIRQPEEIDFEIEYYDLATESVGDPSQLEKKGDRLKEGIRQKGSRQKGDSREKENSSDSHTSNLSYMSHSEFTINNLVQRFVRPFDLGEAPLLRVGLAETGTGETFLLLDKHHIVSDGTSHQLLLRDLTAFYRGDKPVPQHLQYKDYSQWHHSEAQQQVMKEQEIYWLNQFPEEPPELVLPYDYPRPRGHDYEADKVRFRLSAEETAYVRALAEETETTVFMVLLAIFNVLLAKLSGLEDIVVGTPIAGRGHADLEDIMGMFVNTLALRNFPAADRGFQEFLKEVKNRALVAYENQEYPFEDLVDRVVSRRDMSRNPLFDVMFALRSVESTGAVGGLKLTTVKQEINLTFFDLSLIGLEEENSIYFALEYSVRIFKEETVRRYADYFKNIIIFLEQHPDARLGEIGMIGEEERSRLLNEFNYPGSTYPQGKTMVDFFSEQAERTPHSAALVFADETLSYRELQRQSDRLAAELCSCGVGLDSVVGLLTAPGPGAVTGILAIWKAGGAYMPMDPEYPTERISYMLSDSSARLLLTTDSVYPGHDRLDRWQGETVFLGGIDFREKKGTGPKAARSPGIQPRQKEENTHSSYVSHMSNSSRLAYIIYTSGSTGRPKGVPVEHRNIVDYIFTFIRMLRIDERDNVLQQISLSFDASMEELYPTLFKGAKMVIVPRETSRDIYTLTETIERERITLVSVSPLLLNEINKAPVRKLRSLRLVVSGGDVLRPAYIDKIIAAGIDVYNSYGPTEGTVCVSFYKCGGLEKDNIPIGRPIGNRAVYILDKKGSLVPTGVPGELWIGGNGVARGYLNRPELSAEKFVSRSIWTNRTNRSDRPYEFNMIYSGDHDNLYRTGEGAARPPSNYHMTRLLPTIPHQSPITLYRTGDIARWLADGNIEFLGRADKQVKIRGYRVEPGEIEARLLQHEEVKEAAVLAWEDGSGEKYLCAYIAAGNREQERQAGGNEQRALAAKLREFLSAVLPAYMVPAYFVEVDSIPKTPAGKVDSEALPDPHSGTGTLTYIGEEELNKLAAAPDKKEKKAVGEPGETREEKEIPLSDEERERILHLFNNTRKPFSGDKMIHRLFEEQAARTPHRAALTGPESSGVVSYRDLNERANQLARILVLRGIGPGTVVGLMVERSLEMLTAILAILKTGGAYMPIDSELPHKRQVFMLADCAARLLLVNRGLSLPGYETVTLDLDNSENYRGETADLPTVSAATEAVQVLYTSGTTGNPKGVLIENRSLVNFLEYINDLAAVEPGDRIYALAPITFDIFVFQTIGPLLKGAVSVIGSKDELLHPTASAARIVKEKITIYEETPSLVQLLTAQEETASALKSLRCLLLGGEVVPGSLVEKLRSITKASLYNLYGPTEATVMSTAVKITSTHGVTIGTPISNVRVYILSESGKLLPVGEPGELCIGGIAVGRGYVNRPELTAEKFIPDPFAVDEAIYKTGEGAAQPPSRNSAGKSLSLTPCPSPATLYKTGDLARWLPDGKIDFIGRRDYQVKIGGIRMELGEIESYLSSREEVDEAVVSVRENEAGEKYLCAFVVSGKRLREAGLRDYLAQKLPHYMIPAKFLQLEKMPLTAHMKVDRKLLDALEIRAAGSGYIGPANEVERKLAAIWARILQVEEKAIGVEDSFFELGGHSLRAAAAISQIQKEFNVKIPLAELFKSPTIRGIASLISAIDWVAGTEPDSEKKSKMKEIVL